MRFGTVTVVTVGAGLESMELYEQFAGKFTAYVEESASRGELPDTLIATGNFVPDGSRGCEPG